MAYLHRVYDDFEPTTEWASEEGFDTLLVFLPGFKREEIKVQITSARYLRITGEHQFGENQWSRFRKEFPISSNRDSHRISARFDNGILYVKHPKMIVSAASLVMEEEQAQPKPAAETQKLPEPKTELQRPDQKKETKESPKPSEPKSKPELQHPKKTDQRRETAEPPEPLDCKPELQPQKADKEKEPEKTSGKTEFAPQQAPKKENNRREMRGDIAQSGVQGDMDDALGKALQRTKEAEEEKATDTSEKRQKPTESVHGGDRKTTKDTVRNLSGRRSRSRKMEDRHKNVQNLLVKMSKIGNLINLVVAGLLVLALALYIKNAIISRGTVQSGIGQED